MSRTMLLARWPSAVFVLLLGACDSSDSSGGGVPEPTSYEVWIHASDQTVATSAIDLEGLATCDACPPDAVAFGGCPPIQGPFPSAIDVRWTNLTTGAQGQTFHAISGRCSCLFSTCWVSYQHRWFTSVPLALGENRIEINAFGPSFLPGSDTLTVTRVPAAPTGVEADTVEGEIEVRWLPVAAAESYDLYFADGPVFTAATAEVVRGVSSPFRHSGLAPDTTRYYAVAALGGGLSSALSAVSWATAGWECELLPGPEHEPSGASLALALDALDHRHVHRSASATDHVGNESDHVSDETGAWLLNPVARTEWRSADLALDATGVPQLSYLTSRGLVLARRSAGSWSEEVVDARGTCEASLALDALDHAHLAYRATGTPNELRYATNASGAWQHARVSVDPGCGNEPGLSLAVRGDGVPFVLFVGAAPDFALRLATSNGASWSDELVAAGPVELPVLALATDGTPEAVFGRGAGGLWHARRDAIAGWVLERIGEDTYVGGIDFVLDAADEPHVSFLASTFGGQLTYARREAGAWHVLRVTRAFWADTALALDARGAVHLAYFPGSSAGVARRR